MPSTDVSSDSLLPSPLKNHALDLERNGLVFESPDESTTTFECFYISGSSGAWTNEGRSALAEGRYYSGFCEW